MATNEVDTTKLQNSTLRRAAHACYALSLCIAATGWASVLNLPGLPFMVVEGMVIGAAVWFVGIGLIVTDDTLRGAREQRKDASTEGRPASDPGIASMLRDRREAEKRIDMEADRWPIVARDASDLEGFPAGNFEIAFRDLGSIPTLLANALPSQFDRVQPREAKDAYRRRVRGKYHVRVDGPRFDMRLLGGAR